MNRWLELLADRIARSYSNTPVGHAARLNGLRLDEARELCGLLCDRLDTRWDTMVVANRPETNYEVGLDVAIERRNDKSKSRLFIVPADLVAEAAASLADTESHDVTEHLRPTADALLRRLPRELREVVEEAMKGAPASARKDYLCALPESPTLADCGRELWRLGLIPDISMKRFAENRDCVAKLTDPRRAAGSVHQRVEALGLGDGNLKESLTQLLNDTQTENSQNWLRQVAEKPELSLSFDRWTFPERDKVNLSDIEVHSFVDPKQNRPYRWSGLILEEGTLKASTTDSKAKVTVHWSTRPESPTGNPLYEITLETSDPPPLLTKTQKHKAGQKTQSWSFRPSEVERIEGGSLRLRVVIRSDVEGQEEPIISESDEFLLVSEVVESTSSSSAFPITRSIPDFLLERATTTKAVPEVTLCVVDKRDSGSKIEKDPGIKIELDGRQRRRIPLNPMLRAAERKILEEPNKAGRLCLQLSAETRWTTEHLEWASLSLDPQEIGSEEWRRTRRRLFTNIAKSHEDLGLVEACELAKHTDDILSYCRGYANAIEETLEAGSTAPATLHTLETLLYLDTVQLWEGEESTSGDKQHIVGVLVSPLHPLRLLWYLAHEALVREWIRRSSDRSSKVTLPKPVITLQLDGGNYPAFLGDGKTLLYYIDSPFFHWPLFMSAKEKDPHRVATLVRWGLGLGTLDTLAIGQEVAAEVLASRLRGYAELHPYVRTLKVNAVNAGDGQLLVKALSTLDEEAQGESETDRTDEPSALKRAYEIRLYGPPPVHRIGAFLDECASQRRRGQGLPRTLDRLFSPGDTFLRPHLFWAKREIKEIEESTEKPPEEAHISFVTEYFRPEPTLLSEEGQDAENCASTYGLQTDLASDFVADEGHLAWVRTVRLPDSARVTPHPQDKRLTRELLRLHRLLLKALVHLCGGTDDQWPATRVPVSTEQFNLFARLHETSDWVLTVDRNLGVELFDSPADLRTELRENARRYLIDYAPEQIGSAGQQLMISTSWVEEISALLRETLREMFISPTDLACEEVLRLLKSVSGHLVMRVARYPQVAKEAVSLAVVREVLRGKGELDGAFLVPLDDHISILAAPTETGASTQARRPDLLLVRPRLEKKAALQIDFIEIKYRRHRYMAYDPSLWSDMLQATRSGERTLSDIYFPAAPATHLDLPLRRRQLRQIFSFYARRAVRHGLLDPETGAKFLQWLDNFQRDDLSLQVVHRGFVYCPELNCETEDRSHEEMKITLIGRGALPRYTSFHPSEPPSATPGRSTEEEPTTLPPTVTGESRSAVQHSGEAASLLTETNLQKDEQWKREADAQPARDEAGRDTLNILLGHEPQGEKPIYFCPSIRGNPHALIVGIPGMGKTTTVLNICRALARDGVYPFVIDFHGDLARGLQANSGGQPCCVLDAAKGLPFNPLEVDPMRRQDERGWVVHCFEIAEILANIYPSFGELQIGTLRNTLRQCYEAAGFTTSPSKALAPRFVEFWQCLCQKAETDREIRKITTRLEAIFQLQLFKEELSKSFSLAEILSQVTVLDLHRLEIEENQRVAASFFLQRLYRDMFGHGETKQLRNAVVFDEAHRVAKLSLIPKMMQECRKYGILFMLSSQRVEDFDQGVLDSARNHLYLCVNHPDARRLVTYLGASGGVGELTQKLQNLPRYHALFRSEQYQPFVSVRLAEP